MIERNDHGTAVFGKDPVESTHRHDELALMIGRDWRNTARFSVRLDDRASIRTACKP